jgi:hypothetical protein
MLNDAGNQTFKKPFHGTSDLQEYDVPVMKA